MIIKVDGQILTVPSEQEGRMIDQALQKTCETYEKTEMTGQLVITALCRYVLSKIETAVRKLQGKEAALLVRPPRKKEPAIHLAELLANHVRDLVKDAELVIETDGAGNTTAFNFSFKAQGETGGPLDHYGDIGKREDNCSEVS